jgi:hypothetical protein
MKWEGRHQFSLLFTITLYMDPIKTPRALFLCLKESKTNLNGNYYFHLYIFVYNKLDVTVFSENNL